MLDSPDRSLSHQRREDSVSVGDEVRAGQVLLVLEAMKMEHTLRAPHDGTVIEVDPAPGDQVEAGTVLLVVESSEPMSTQG